MRRVADHQASKIGVGRAIVLACVASLLQPIASAQSDADMLEAARGCQRRSEVSDRLACYDRVFPPIVDSVDAVADLPEPQSSAALAPPASPLAPTAQVVEVETVDLRTTRFRAADGRVFVRSNATTLLRWPETPFDVEVQSGAFGTIYLKLAQSNVRIRVAILE